LQDYHPERLNKVFITHPDLLFTFAFGLVKPFLNQRTKDKIILMDDFSGLKKYYHPDQLLK
jgi:hypothetical protein